MSGTRRSYNGRITRALGTAGCAIAVLALAASPAGAFTRTLKVTLPAHRIVWGLAVDRGGDMFVATPNSIPGAGFDTSLATKVIEMTPHGQKIREISGRVLIGGDQQWVAGDVAVTPNGAVVFLSGGVTPNGSDFQPFVGEYSAATGRFIRGSQFDLDSDDFGGPAAVDSTGQHLYVADSSSFGADTQKPTRIFELNVGDLSPVRQFTLQGLPQNSVESIAVGGPDDDVFVTLVPQTAHDDSFVQVYRPDGTFLRQFAVAPSTDVAVNAHGDVFLGGTHGFGMHGADGTGRKGIGDAAGVFGVSVDGSDEVFGIESTAKRASIVKFVPQVPQTRIVDAPPPGLTELKDTPTVTFKFKSSTPSSTFECRLERRGFDTVPFGPCSDPQTFPNTPNGTYRLDVRAVSSDGAPDPTPASVRFKVRVVYAHAHITSHPAKLSALTTATFTFTSSTPGATFKCRLTPYLTAPAAFKPCASPVAYPGLTHDLYTFQVEAITTDGFTEPNAHSFTFAVDPVAPHVSKPVAKIMPVQQVGPLGETAVTWGWSATDPNTPTKQLLDTLQGRSASTVAQLGAYVPQPGAQAVAGQMSAAIPMTPGLFYQFQALAQNGLGVVGAGPASAPVHLATVDQSDPSVSFSGDWAQGVHDTDAIGATVAKAVTAGAKAKLMFTGSSIAMIGNPGPQRGVVKACVDGQCSAVSTDAGSKGQRSVVFAANGLGAGQHTIVVEAKTAPILLDGFVVLS